MKIALAYDRVNKWGGAESVLLALHAIWPDAPLYTSVYDQKAASWAKVFDVRTSFLQKLPLPKNAHEYYPYLMGIAFESFNFDKYDLVLSVTHEFAKAIITKPHTKHVCYCLTPTSYLWSGYNAYFSDHSSLFRQVTSPAVQYLRFYDKIICHRPDKYIAISQTVQKRIEKYYGLPSDVIYPPVNVDHPNTKNITRDTKFFLIVSRLVPNKQIDIAVRAFNQLGLPLKIVGTGRQEQKLKQMAKSNIEFLGHLTDEELSRYYQSCLAVIVPGQEDFGIVSVEAQSFGKPVVALRAGGSTETVVEGKTGWFFDRPAPQSLVQTLQNVRLDRIDKKKCLENTQKFNKERFKKEIQNYVRHC